MGHELICSWLKVPAEPWPPDHYTLLGLERGEKDPQRIEHQVQERLERLRRYQLLHPEPVTEAMNCLARAYCCLGDPEAKKAYDAQLLNPSAAASPPTPVPANDPLGWLIDSWNEQAQAVDPEQLPDLSQAQVVDWATAPPPPPRTDTAAGNEAEAPAPATAEAGTPLPVPPAPPAIEQPPEPAEKKPEGPSGVTPSPVWNRDLVTRRALLERISQTRQLLRAWHAVGRSLGQAGRRLTRRQDALHLVRQLGAIRKQLHGFPPLLGQAGQAGYLVVALSRQQLIIQTFLTLLPSQREALARDWQAGQALLVQYRRFLKHEVMRLRQRSRTARAARMVQCYFGRHLGLGLLLLALLTLNLTFPPRPWLLIVQLGVILAGATIDWVLYRRAKRRAWLQRSRPVARTSSPRRPQPQPR